MRLLMDSLEKTDPVVNRRRSRVSFGHGYTSRGLKSNRQDVNDISGLI
jgi:hypothetical protein